MVRISKLYAQLLSDPRAALAFRDFERLLEAFGFILDRTKGSHRQYVHPAVPFVLTVQPDGKDAKRYQVRQFLAMVAEFGLSMEE
ncbi:type II toxin-antitoxin system HicA family toxin [Sphingomonas sp. ABOLD]|uniref:Putative RNA binding protein YcfA (HicA-like mRNA interferase family) n=1 Tax=Sphingomonas trueperi TaxID=53317 RepID=A0A7X5Y2M8_9SPHN|nr:MULTISPECIES: type II toxin-antitoxin system HicA family toxin [Sphingomonas]NJB98316.1 putative RNA binding protein YcfA (HicA-like mRNA interferase family) [Sphingomonas trueperi]RSV44768.1 type II toxin-antitoxin system HicA family toxin [Sphingomonas sp. ABOLD]RSV45452.1 type II toxin-antitoxin system HicA family toxin [Sphingomonas sp. ABOLE]